MSIRLPAACLLALSLMACTTTGVQHAPAAAGSPSAVPANDNLNAVLWMQSSAEFRASMQSLYHAAITRLDDALADPAWDALAPGERDNPDAFSTLPPAVILDIDETVLDNSPYQARLVVDGTEFDDATWADWVDEQRARPLPGVLEFARAATERGITMVYISNREHDQTDETLANLRAVGLPAPGSHVIMGKGMEVEGCTQQGSSSKLCRRQLAGRQYRVLMQFGDQLGDFIDAPAAAPAELAALVDRHGSWFGERWWMLPNPTYGGWEPATFNNDWSQSTEQRRRAKRAALDTARP